MLKLLLFLVKLNEEEENTLQKVTEVEIVPTSDREEVLSTSTLIV